MSAACCLHGNLGRACPVCDLLAEVRRLEGENRDLCAQLATAQADTVALRAVLNQVAGGPVDPATYRLRTLARNAIATPAPGASLVEAVRTLVEAATSVMAYLDDTTGWLATNRLQEALAAVRALFGDHDAPA